MKGGRTFAIGDIHGCAQSFLCLLEMLRLDGNDTLYLLGDLIDRGPDSKKVIDSILQLQKDGHDIRPILGNHEQMLLAAARSDAHEDLLVFLENGGRSTLDAFGVDHPSKIPEEYLEFMGSLPLYRQNETHIFVHAGLSCDLKEPISARDHHEMLWKSSGSVSSSYLSGKKLVTGHLVMTLDKIRESLKTDHFQIDNGCVYGRWLIGKGNLIAVDLGTNELAVQPNIEDIAAQ